MRSAKALPRLIATDLDGTLLHSTGTISARTERALVRARAAGVETLLVTGRPPRHVSTIVGVQKISATAVCLNGAVLYDLASREIVAESRLSGKVARDLVTELRTRLPGIYFAVEVGLDYGWEPAYEKLRHRAELPPLALADALKLAEFGVSKLIARQPALVIDELLERSREILADRAVVSYSGAPFLEIGAPDVSKASAVASYCAARGIERGEVIAFGDMPNDLPMLAWASRSVAMANAHAFVLAAVHEITASNDEDGVARIVEQLLD